MKIVALLVIALAVCAFCYDPKLTGAQWQGKSGQEKFQTIDSELKKVKKPYGWYSAVHQAELFVEGMDKTFDFTGDDMPDQGLFGAEQRPKLIHSVGVVADAKFIPIGSYNYTGLFRGADDCFLRFSLATKPTTKPPVTIPGISLKCMRNGVESGNVFAMYSIAGQESFNFFEHDFTNHPPEFADDSVDFATRQLKNKFKEASRWPTFLGLSGLARYDQNGVEADKPIFPFRLVLHPTTALHKMFPSAPQSGDSFFVDQLSTLQPGVVYTVLAQREPTSLLDTIGNIVITESPAPSKFGDKDMFFQHTRMEDDVAIRPEWTSDIEAIVAEQQSIPGYAFPDLPFN